MNEFTFEVAKLVLAIVLIVSTWFCFELVKLKRFYGTLKRLGIPGPEPSIAKSGNSDDLYEHFPKRDIINDWLKEFGNVFGFYWDYQINIVTNDLDILKTVFVDKQDIFGEQQDVVSDDLFSSSIIANRRDRWKAFRRVFAATQAVYASNSPDAVQTIKDSARELVDYIGKSSQKLDDGTIVSKDIDVSPIIDSYSIAAFARIGMPDLHCFVGDTVYPRYGRLIFEEEDPYYDLANKYPFLAPLINRLKRMFLKSEVFEGLNKHFNETIDKTVKYLQMRRQQGTNYKGGSTDEEKQLDEAYENNANKTYIRSLTFTFIKLYFDNQVSYEELIAILFSSFTGSYDAITRVYINLLWVLGKRHDIQDKAREEVKKNGWESHYLYQITQETFRRYTVSNILRRKSNQACSIKGYNFPKGTVFVHHSNSIHNNPDIWPEPQKFDPERFREGVKIHPCALAPFGFGAKQCPSIKYSYNAIKITLAELLMKYKIKTVSPDNLELELWGLTINKASKKIIVDFESLQSI